MATLNYVSFNQDHSMLAVGTSRGLRIYTVDPWDLHTETTQENVAVVEQLFSTSLVAMILTPRLLRLVNTKKGTTICELSFHSMVLAIKMNRKRLVVVCEEGAYVYDISNMNRVHTQLTPTNAYGICALSSSSENNYLALPHYQKSATSTQGQASNVPKSATREAISGDVLLFDANKLEEVTLISAHQTPLSCITINSEGTLLATASEKGTVIRVFSLPDAKLLHQFRRGSMPARIYSMSFNATSTLLVVSSATETVHIFKLAPPGSQRPNSNNGPDDTTTSNSPPTRSLSGTSKFSRDRSASPSDSDPDPYSPRSPSPPSYESTMPPPPKPSRVPNPGLMSLMRRTSQTVSTSLVSRAANYLPSSVTEMWEPQRDFAWVRVPRSASGTPARSVVAMSSQSPTVYVATSEGGFFQFSIDLERGGEGTMVRKYEYVGSGAGRMAFVGAWPWTKVLLGTPLPTKAIWSFC